MASSEDSAAQGGGSVRGESVRNLLNLLRQSFTATAIHCDGMGMVTKWFMGRKFCTRYCGLRCRPKPPNFSLPIFSPHHSAALKTPTSAAESRSENRKGKTGLGAPAYRCCPIRVDQSPHKFRRPTMWHRHLRPPLHFLPPDNLPYKDRRLLPKAHLPQQLKAAPRRERDRLARDLSLLSEWWQLTTCLKFCRPAVWRSRHSHPQPPLQFLSSGAQNLAAALLAINKRSSCCPIFLI